MIRVTVLGARGYTALELLKLLLRHPKVEVRCLGTRDAERTPLGIVHPELAGRLDLELRQLTTDEIIAESDCVFSCLPHGANARTVRELSAGGLPVVDFSADYRLHDPAIYQQWYGLEHQDPAGLATAVYGLPELFREQLRTCRLVANPGCYPTSAILAAAPFVAGGHIELSDLVFDSKSGVSGAGRNAKPQFHFPECNEAVSAYAVGEHRHTPEIQQILSRVAGDDCGIVFTPHLIPMNRGILTTMYAKPTSDHTAEEYREIAAEFYRDEPFVRVADPLPTTRQVAHSNFCDLSVRVAGGRVIVISVIDNLIKGAAGAAVQNFNIMHGFAETTALL